MLFIDFETHYTKEYSLKNLNYYQYIQDERFNILGAAIIHNDEPTQWLTSFELAAFLDELRRDPPETVVAHNLFFDGLILTQLNITTELWIDTLSMARALLPPGTPLSLDALAKHYNLGQKLEGLPMGIASWDELSPEAQRRLKYYAINDVELLKKLYYKLAPKFPSKEFELIDLTMRMAFNPHLQLNMPLAQQLLTSVGDRKTQLIKESGLSEKMLASNKQFSEWLLANSYDIPMKISPTTGKPTPALGKSDQAFLDLLEDNPELEPIVEARLAVKSTLETTRLTTLIETQQLMEGIPVPLKYYGGHTGRWSGLFYNLQNLPKKSEIRNTLEAPENETLVIVDSAAIEARVLAWLAGQEFALNAYKNNEDLYKVMAGKIYNKDPTEVTKDERTLGKIAVLGCGYGMGVNKFILTCKTYGVTISEELAQTTIDTYRETYNLVRNLWRTFDSYIQIMTKKFAEKSGKTPWIEYTAPNERIHPTLIFTTEKIILPNGLALHYQNLHQNNSGEYIYGIKNNRKVYGAKIVENIVQALARTIIAEQMLEAHKTLSGTLVLSVHDEIVISTNIRHAESTLQNLINIMKTPPIWAHTCPLDAEGSISKFYKK
jgi:DNA polymerase